MQPILNRLQQHAYIHMEDPYFVEYSISDGHYTIDVVHTRDERSDEGTFVYDILHYDSREGAITLQERVGLNFEEGYVRQSQILEHSDPA